MPGPARILVVEDEARIAEVVQSYLEGQGHTVDWAATGEDALAAAARRRPDLVILDLGLPGMSGEEVCRRLRAQSDVPIIMLTAKDAEEDLVRGLQLGADDYVTKPFSPRELTARVRALLRRARPDERPSGGRAGARRRAAGGRQRRAGASPWTASRWSSRSPSSACSRRSPASRAASTRAPSWWSGCRAWSSSPTSRTHHRRPHQEPAPQAGRRRPRAAARPHGVRPRLRLRGGPAVRRGLRFRLALTHLVVAVLAIVVVGSIVTYTGSRRFDSYLQQVQSKRNAAVVTSLQSTYKPPRRVGRHRHLRAQPGGDVQQRRRRRLRHRRAAAVHRPGAAYTGSGMMNGNGQGMMNGSGQGTTASGAATPQAIAAQRRRLHHPERADHGRTASRSAGPRSTRPRARAPRPRTRTRARSPATSSSPPPSPAFWHCC